MRILFTEIIGAIGIGITLALIRYYTMYFTLKWIKGRLTLRRRQKEAGNGHMQANDR